MIETVILDFLDQLLPVPVVMEFPADAPERFVLLKVEHNPREEHLDSALLVADSYGGSLLDAAKLNELVKIALDKLIELDEIASAKRGGDYAAFDTKNMRYRYQALQNITHY